MNEKIYTLDHYVNAALDFFEKEGDYKLKLPNDRTLAVGSQNGYWTARILFRFSNATFFHAKEMHAKFEIDSNFRANIIDSVTIVSASGSRDVVNIAGYALDRKLQVNLITCKSNSEIKQIFGDKINETVVRTISEPRTINTASYGRLIYGVTHESIDKIRAIINSLQEPSEGYDSFGAFTFIFPDDMVEEVASMTSWKLQEIIGRQTGTLSTYLTNFLHGAGVIDCPEELYIAIGLNAECKRKFEDATQHVPIHRKHFIDIPSGSGPMSYLFTAYTIIGKIQKAYPAFQESLVRYVKK